MSCAFCRLCGWSFRWTRFCLVELSWLSFIFFTYEKYKTKCCCVDWCWSWGPGRMCSSGTLRNYCSSCFGLCCYFSLIFLNNHHLRLHNTSQLNQVISHFFAERQSGDVSVDTFLSLSADHMKKPSAVISSLMAEWSLSSHTHSDISAAGTEGRGRGRGGAEEESWRNLWQKTRQSSEVRGVSLSRWRILWSFLVK